MPKYVIEREIPGAGKMTPEQLQAVSQLPAGCSVNLARKSSGSTATSRMTRFTASTMRRTKPWFANTPPKAASPPTKSLK